MSLLAALRHLRRCAIAVALCLLPVLALAQTSALHQAGAGEDSVKAAYLLKFLNYVAWPAAAFAGPDAPYVIGVAGDDGVLAELQRQATGHGVSRRPVAVRRIVPGDPLAGLQVLYVGERVERARLAAWLRQLHGAPVLAVSDADGGLQLGSMINFRLVDERVRFEVALEPVRRAGLELNTRLLSVAVNVLKGMPP